MILHLSQIFLTLALTFIFISPQEGIVLPNCSVRKEGKQLRSARQVPGRKEELYR